MLLVTIIPLQVVPRASRKSFTHRAFLRSIVCIHQGLFTQCLTLPTPKSSLLQLEAYLRVHFLMPPLRLRKVAARQSSFGSSITLATQREDVCERTSARKPHVVEHIDCKMSIGRRPVARAGVEATQRCRRTRDQMPSAKATGKRSSSRRSSRRCLTTNRSSTSRDRRALELVSVCMLIDLTY